MSDFVNLHFTWCRTIFLLFLVCFHAFLYSMKISLITVRAHTDLMPCWMLEGGDDRLLSGWYWRPTLVKNCCVVENCIDEEEVCCQANMNVSKTDRDTHSHFRGPGVGVHLINSLLKVLEFCTSLVLKPKPVSLSCSLIFIPYNNKWKATAAWNDMRYTFKALKLNFSKNVRYTC